MTSLTESPFSPTITSTAPASYIDEAETGNGSGVRYIIGTILIFVGWLIVGTIVTAVVAIAVLVTQGSGFTVESFNNLLLSPPPELALPALLVVMSSFIPFFLSVWLVTRFFHNRPFRSLITWRPRINWGRVGLGFGLWLLISLVSTGVDVLLRPGMYTWQPNWGLWLPYAIVALLLIPIQAGTEELFFRGYLMQATSKLSRNFFVLVLPSSLLFMALHLGNQEVASDTLLLSLFYLAFGVFAAILSLKDGTTELGIGVHVANNLFGALAATFPESSLPSPAPLLKASLEPALDLTLFIMLAALFYLIVFYGLRRATSKEAPASASLP